MNNKVATVIYMKYHEDSFLFLSFTYQRSNISWAFMSTASLWPVFEDHHDSTVGKDEAKKYQCNKENFVHNLGKLYHRFHV